MSDVVIVGAGLACAPDLPGAGVECQRLEAILRMLGVGASTGTGTGTESAGLNR